MNIQGSPNLGAGYEYTGQPRGAAPTYRWCSLQLPFADSKFDLYLTPLCI